MIEFKNVKLNIKNIDISNNISFSIQKNDVTCLIGNKNAGKSSILKMLAGIYKNYYGEILINGIDLSINNDIKIDLVHDSIEYDSYITVSDYLKFYATIYNSMSENELNNYIDKRLKEFSLMSYKHTNLNQLDKESYKLVDIIRVLIHDPDIILFDNLFFSDNIDYNIILLNFVKTLVGKKTIIFAARNLNYIEEICDNIGILENGVLAAFGNIESILEEADIINRFELKVMDDVSVAIDSLKSFDCVKNISFNENTIIFSIFDESKNYSDIERTNIETKILKKLVCDDIKVYSYKKLPIKYSQLLGD